MNKVFLVGRLTRDPELRTLPSGKPVANRAGAGYTNAMKTTAHPAAYLRRSFVDADSPGDISRDSQRAAVRRLAEADGHNGNLVEYDDWGVSADIAKSAKRTAYARLLADMEAGQVTAVYAFDLDRLYRDPRDLIRLQDAAKVHRVRIVTPSGSLAIGDTDDPAAEGFAFIGAVFGRMELQKAKKRARATRDARQARGDRFGRPSYGYRWARDPDGRVYHAPNPAEPLQPVLDAYQEAGSFNGAAKLLNARGIPSQRSKAWAGNVVNRIIRRERPGLAPRGRVDARVASRGSQRFSRLLRCACGQIMTPRVSYTRSKYGTFGPYTGYQCYKGRADPRHPRPYMVHESRILEWAKAEAARLRPVGPDGEPFDALQFASQNLERRAVLLAQRERLGWAVTDGLLDREQAKAKASAIGAELAQLDDQEQMVEIPVVDWSWEPKEINAVLRALWDHVELDAEMRPIRAIWRVPEWRAT